jgi:hypothetical protein
LSPSYLTYNVSSFSSHLNKCTCLFPFAVICNLVSRLPYINYLVFLHRPVKYTCLSYNPLRYLVFRLPAVKCLVSLLQLKNVPVSPLAGFGIMSFSNLKLKIFFFLLHVVRRFCPHPRFWPNLSYSIPRSFNYILSSHPLNYGSLLLSEFKKPCLSPDLEFGSVSFARKDICLCPYIASHLSLFVSYLEQDT